MKTGLCKLLSRIFLVYLKLVAFTGKVVVENKELIKENTMVGYWHGDSYCMHLVLEDIVKEHEKIHVVVTSDTRGNIIEEMLKTFGANAIRLPDGIKMRHYLRSLIKFSKENDGILALSFDGPTGPLHEPKKLLFILAVEAEKQVVYIRFEYKRVLRLKNRWDRYVIPLPFCEITAVVENLGIICNEDVRNFEVLKQRIRY